MVVDDILCPAGTDPSLNFFGLIGRCGERQAGMRWAIYNAAGQEQDGNTDSFGQVVFQVDSGVWTVTALHSGNVPSVLYCNVRDENGQEPPHYAPFVTYTYGETGAVMNLEQYMTWRCIAYTIPMTTGDGSDTADVSLTALACPDGTTAPTTAACVQPLAGLTVHLLYAAETIVSTKATDANGFTSWLAPQNLSVFGLAEEVPAGYVLAANATCVKNGVEATYPVIDGAIVDLGSLTATDSVHCTLFNIPDPDAPAADLELEEMTAEDAPEAINEPADGDISLIEEGSTEIDESVETEDTSDGDNEPVAETPENELVPLDADE